MRLSSLWLGLLGLALILCLPMAPANAQASRTWVSGVGDDANPCSRTAPCKTFAGAISKTAPGGEIDVLDPGGFGAVTITKSITIDGGGVVASVLVAGTNGIIVSGQPTDVVILKNIRFQGLLGNGSNPAGAGINAIRFLSGAMLVVENCDIVGFNANGISIESGTSGSITSINNVRIDNVGNDGINVAGTASKATIHNVQVSKSVKGLEVGNGATVTVDNSVFTKASTAAIEVNTGGTAFADFVQMTQSGNGLLSTGTFTIGNSDISFNVTAFNVTVAATSFGNNRLVGNTALGTAPTLGAASTDHTQQ